MWTFFIRHVSLPQEQPMRALVKVSYEALRQLEMPKPHLEHHVQRCMMPVPDHASYLADCKLMTFPIALYKVMRHITEGIHLITLANNELKSVTSKFITTFSQLRDRLLNHASSSPNDRNSPEQVELLQNRKLCLKYGNLRYDQKSQI
ncbi:hypothetical protein lerEdw1_001965 [Lerista edwardsae]|nr:hypothetical protein lerEdw1_001965 [Lerista edwardsae]